MALYFLSKIGIFVIKNPHSSQVESMKPLASFSQSLDTTGFIIGVYCIYFIQHGVANRGSTERKRKVVKRCCCCLLSEETRYLRLKTMLNIYKQNQNNV